MIEGSSEILFTSLQQDVHAQWFVQYQTDSSFLSSELDRVVEEGCDRDDGAVSARLESHSRLLLLHLVEPVLLRVLDPGTHFKPVYAGHLDVGQHEPECSRAAFALQSLLEALNSLRA